MATYKVLVEGTGFEITSTDGVTSRSFVVSVVGKGKDEQEASMHAATRVLQEWASGKYAYVGVMPAIKTHGAFRLGLLPALTAKDNGYIFHPGVYAIKPE